MIGNITSTKAAATPRPYRILGYALGLLVAAMAVAQMVSFEEFVRALQEYRVVGGNGSVAVAVTLVALEVFSVPFLFRLTLSPFARLLSAFCVVLLPCAWTALTTTVLLDGLTVANAGYFGGFLGVSVGAGALVLNILWIGVVGASFVPMGGEKALKMTSKS